MTGLRANIERQRDFTAINAQAEVKVMRYMNNRGLMTAPFIARKTGLPESTTADALNRLRSTGNARSVTEDCVRWTLREPTRDL